MASIDFCLPASFALLGAVAGALVLFFPVLTGLTERSLGQATHLDLVELGHISPSVESSTERNDTLFITSIMLNLFCLTKQKLLTRRSNANSSHFY